MDTSLIDRLQRRSDLLPFHVLLCFNCLDSRSSLVAFLIHHVRLAAVPLHCACLPIVSQISLSDAWRTLLPHCSLTGEMILPSSLLNGLVLMGTTAFSHGSSIQGSRCARTEEEGTFPDVPRCVLCMQDQASAWHLRTEPSTPPSKRSHSEPWTF